jgi:hypothetical protein
MMIILHVRVIILWLLKTFIMATPVQLLTAPATNALWQILASCVHQAPFQGSIVYTTDSATPIVADYHTLAIRALRRSP